MSEPAGSVTLSPTALAFGAAMLVLGVVIGWLAHGQPPAPAPSTALEARAPVAVEVPDGEAKAVTAKKKGPPPTMPAEPDPGAPPADSPFLTADIVATFDDPESEAAYRRAVAFVAQDNARAGMRTIVSLEDACTGKPWREQGLAVVIMGRAQAGEVGAPRYLAKAWRQQYPESPFLPAVAIAEAQPHLTQARKTRKPRGGSSVEDQKAQSHASARGILEEALIHAPKGPFASEAQRLIDGL